MNNKIQLNKNDLVINIDEQIKFLIGKDLQVSDKDELKYIIINYGFNNLFRKYSPPFLKKIMNNDDEMIYKENTSEISILKLYYFDYTLTNIIIEFMGSFELKLTANIVDQINYECPDYKKQLNYLWPNIKEQENIIKPIIKASKNGSDYLKPFVENNIYPSWTILGEMTLGAKLKIFSKLKNINQFLKNFYLSDFTKKEFFTINFDFIRPLRNVLAHFDRLFKYHIILNENQSKLFKKFMKKFIFNEKYLEQVLYKNLQLLDTFDLILILLCLLGDARAKKFVEKLKLFIKDYGEKNSKYFNVNDFLINNLIYDWPQDWSDILDHVLENKIF